MNYREPRLGYVGGSYETVEHPSVYRYAPQTYPLSLGQLPPPAPLPGRFSLANLATLPIKQILAVVLVIIIAALVMRQLLKMTRAPAKVERNAVVSRVSTKELAQRLYDRLENKGRANPATMRSLERIAR